MYKLIYELQSLPGTKAKQEFIKKHSDNEYFKEFLTFALCPMMTYNISDKTAKIFTQPITPDNIKWDSIFELAEELLTRGGLNNSQIEEIHQFLWTFEEDERNLYIGLLSKSLRLGVTTTTVNKMIPNLIPVWDVQQAFSIEQCDNWHNQTFWLTQKLNGVRATYYKGKLISRNGTPYTGLDHIITRLNEYSDNLVYDGELTLLNKGALSDNEAFRKATGIINSDAEDKLEIMYTVFDVVPLVEFDTKCTTTYSNRRKLMDNLEFNSPYIYRLPVLYSGTNESMIYSLLDEMVAQDKEGLMLNLDVPYQRKRHNGILKVKRFYTMDLPIIAVEEGDGRLKGTAGNLVVDFKGNQVRVGSGLKDVDRKFFWENKESITGTLCEVKYKEISTDKGTGKESLQFPIFISLRTDKDVVSYS